MATSKARRSMHRRRPPGTTGGGGFERVFDRSQDPTVVVDGNGRLAYVNPSAQEAFGYRDVLGTEVLDLLHPQDRSMALEGLAAASDGDGLGGVFTYRARTADGRWRLCETVATNLLDDPDVAGIVIVLRDVTDRARAEAEARAATSFTETVLDTTTALVLTIDLEGRLLSMNRAAEVLTGRRSQEVAGRSFKMFVPDADRAGIDGVMRDMNDGDPSTAHENHWIAADGSLRMISWTSAVLTDTDGEIRSIVATGIDVTESRRAAAAERAAEQRFRAAFDSVPVGMALLDGKDVVERANERFCGLFGIGPTDAVAHPVADLDLGGQAVADLVARPHIQIVTAPDGEPRWRRLRATALDPGHLLEVEDVTDTHRERDRLAWEASHDGLTGLANRAGLLHRLDGMLIDADDPPALLFIDLDGFKRVNDGHGHAAGDEVLKVVAERILNEVRTHDLVARLGGDEFVIACPGLASGPARRAAHRIERALAHPVTLPSGPVRIGGSIGVVCAMPGDGADDLLVRADRAMYESKRRRYEQTAMLARTPQPWVAPRHPQERARLMALRALERSGTEKDPFVATITAMAAELCGVPIAAVTLVDSDRQRFAALLGLSVDSTSRDEGFCAHTILTDDVLVIEDTHLDPRFEEGPLVIGDPHIRFYAGAPLALADGPALGALCVIDVVPRRITEEQIVGLESLRDTLARYLTGRVAARRVELDS